MTARRHEMDEELNDGNAVAAINVVAKVYSIHKHAVPLALLEGFGPPTVPNLCHKCYSWTQVELRHLKRIVAKPQLRSSVSRKAVRK